MAISTWNPLSLFGPLILVCFSIPLAFFAAVTTSLACGALLLRVSIVYFELSFAVIHSYLFAPSKIDPSFHSPHPRTPKFHSAQSSSASLSSNSPPHKKKHKHTNSDSATSLVTAHSPTLDRDFEGVGGWRRFGSGEEESLWIGMNSRLELPAVVTSDFQRKHHRRSLTASGSGQTGSWSPEGLRISPSHSRSRTRVPTPAADYGAGAEGYFTLTPYGMMTSSLDNLRNVPSNRRMSSGAMSTGSNTSIQNSLSKIRNK